MLIQKLRVTPLSWSITPPPVISPSNSLNESVQLNDTFHYDIYWIFFFFCCLYTYDLTSVKCLLCILFYTKANQRITAVLTLHYKHILPATVHFFQSTAKFNFLSHLLISAIQIVASYMVEKSAQLLELVIFVIDK